MHVLTALRHYLGITQTGLAQITNVTQADISEMETHAPYGQADKYQRVSSALGIPIEAIVKNDFRHIPVSFFENHSAPPYLPTPTSSEHLLGRQGEEFILRRERDRLADLYPALSKLVLPYFKMKMRGGSPGYDILSFDDTGIPFYLEVKTSLYDTNGFRITNNELDTATKTLQAGEHYVVCQITNWGTKKQYVRDIPFEELQNHYRINPCYYFCRPTPPPAGPVSGLSYYRQLRGITQTEFAEMLGLMQCNLSLYENGQHKPSINFYLRVSELVDVPLDELMAQYDAPPKM